MATWEWDFLSPEQQIRRNRTLTQRQHKRLERVDKEYGDNAIVTGWDDSRTDNEGPTILIFDTGGSTEYTLLKSGTMCREDSYKRKQND